ncbi:MAG: cell division protein FtsA [Candidatus Eisenbacteria bacterium]|nr:cell division protein FtsA [Candidatus Eisenbacteria bacterium]
MAAERMITGIDIGTSKVCTVVAEVAGEGDPEIVGVGLSRSEGVRRGVVVNVEKTVEAVARSVQEAERMAGVKVDEAFVGISGRHIQGVNSSAVIAVSRTHDEITPGDLERVLDQAQAVSIPSDRRVLHVLPLEFAVDDQDGIRNPVGMSGIRLETEVHIITAAATSARNVEKCVHRAGVEVKELVLEGYASSHAVLEEDERELGAVLLDIGGGNTNVTLFLNGSIHHTSSIGLGGENVTSDIAIGLRTPLAEAEALKIHYGHALAAQAPADREIQVPGIGGRADRAISQQVLCSIIESRVEEILELAYREARGTDLLDLIGGGVVVTGGTADLRGVADLVEAVFEMPVKVGTPRRVVGLMDEVNTSRFSTAVGLVRYGRERERRGSVRAPVAFRTGGGLQRMGSWLKAVVNQF